MRKHPWFSPGDRARVRSWEDMEQEYGIGYATTINVPFHFVVEMRQFCGKEFVVTDVMETSFDGKACQRVYGLTNSYSWSNEMLEYAEPPVVCEIGTIDALI